MQTSWLLEPCYKPAAIDENGITANGSRDLLCHSDDIVGIIDAVSETDAHAIDTQL